MKTRNRRPVYPPKHLHGRDPDRWSPAQNEAYFYSKQQEEDSQTDPSDYEGAVDFHTIMTRTQNDVINSSRNPGFMAKILQDSGDDSNSSFVSENRSSDSSSVSSFEPDVTYLRLPKREKSHQKFFHRSGTKRSSDFRSVVEVEVEIERAAQKISQNIPGFPNFNQMGSASTNNNYKRVGNTIVIPYLQTTPYDNHVTVYDPTDAKQYSEMMNMLKHVTLASAGAIPCEQMPKIDVELAPSSKTGKEKSKKNMKKENFDFSNNEDNTYRSKFIKKLSKNQNYQNLLKEMDENEDETPKPAREFKAEKKLKGQKEVRGQRNSQKIDVAVHLNVNNGGMVNPTENPKRQNHHNRDLDAQKLGKLTPKMKFDPETGERIVHHDENPQTSEVKETKTVKKREKSPGTSRRYTLEDYKAIQEVPELPKSLGPDWSDIQEKSKALNRKVLYSYYVSAKNANISRVNKVPMESKHCSKWQKSRQYGKGTYLYLNKNF